MKEKQVGHSDCLSELVGHEHHCYICGDEDNLFWVTADNKSQGILCKDCIDIQKRQFKVRFISLRPYR